MRFKNQSSWRKVSLALSIALVLAGLVLIGNALAHTDALTANFRAPDRLQAAATPAPKSNHSEFAKLQGPFETPQEVTKACLSCHVDFAQQVMKTSHWTWEYINQVTGQTVGKKTLINNFCIGIQSNEPRCTSCHAGYGWSDKNFDFTKEENVDCLVCHDTTNTYKKFPTGAGLPASEPKEFPVGSGVIWEPPDLAKIAQNVGPSSRQTCGACHFYGGGNDGVKHGDLDSSLVQAPLSLDVHMSPEGQNFTCTTCHITSEHQIAGSRYSMDPNQWKGCETCHTDSPHNFAILNRHVQNVACQTCHVPEYARGGVPTKMTWDWSKAGKLTEDGKPVVLKDEQGHVIYDGQKGEFTLQENVTPEYFWFNGQVEYTLAGDVIDPSGVVNINKFMGDKDDPDARIWPFKRFQAVQPYDSGNNTLVIPHLFGKDDSAYWGNYDWNKAITFGMEYAGLPYSGQYGFVSSDMFWPITHMVAPASEALQCRNCHTGSDSRLDFVALGYSETEAKRLTSFPPTLTIEALNLPLYSPDSCVACHPDEYNLWTQSRHYTNSVGCVACHPPLGEGEHPAVPFTMENSAETCGACHLDEYGDWNASQHSEINVTCASCHNPHSQKNMTIDGNATACETCHTTQKEDAHHSTHQATGMTCNDCHRNTERSTGHDFAVGSDTCLKCHLENIHSSGLMVNAGIDIKSVSVEAPAATPTPVAVKAEETAKGAGIVLPAWLLLIVGAILGAGLNWLLSTRRLGPPDAHPDEDQEEEPDTSDQQTTDTDSKE